MSTTVDLSQREMVPLGDWTAHVVRWAGDRDRPVVLLHGFTSHAQSWQHLASALEAAHEVVALDQRGHGRSAPTPRHGTRPMVADLHRLLDHLGWERAAFVGQSMGGMNAMLFAAEAPERVERLVVVDIGPEVSPAALLKIRAGTSRPDSFGSVNEAVAEARLIFPRADEALLRSRVVHNLVPHGDGRWTWRTAPELRAGTAERDDHSLAERWEAWRTIVAPTLLVHGGASDVLTPHLVTMMLTERPQTRLATIRGATHSVPLDRPIELARTISDFLAEPGSP